MVCPGFPLPLHQSSFQSCPGTPHAVTFLPISTFFYYLCFSATEPSLRPIFSAFRWYVLSNSEIPYTQLAAPLPLLSIRSSHDGNWYQHHHYKPYYYIFLLTGPHIHTSSAIYRLACQNPHWIVVSPYCHLPPRILCTGYAVYASSSTENVNELSVWQPEALPLLSYLWYS